jgi:hypothetical protein
LVYVIAALMGLIAVVMLGLLIYHFTVAPIDNEPGTGWIFLIEFILMGAVSILLLNFHTLNLILTYDGVILKFGRFKKVVPWSDIESYRAITTGNFSSGGLHFGLTRGGWSAAYTVLGKPTIILRLRSSGLKEITFSAGNPQEVMKIMRNQTGKDAASQL